jgi:lipopolysaccharide export system ATP-binding protein
MNTSKPNGKHAEESGLVVSNIKKSFKQRHVLSDVSFHLGQGEVVALLGPNGAGKTTCFYSVVGLIRPDAGTVTVNGRDATQLPMYRRAQLGIGYLPQEASIFRGMNVEDNILSILEIWEPNKAEQKIKLEQLLEEFSITYIRKSPATALSGGERRRVEIARCLASNPKFVLLDEPFAGVDPIAVGDIRDLVAKLKSRDIGVLITDHNVRETLEIVDRAYILHGGKVLMSGTPKEVVSDANVRSVYLGSTFKI